MKLFRAVTACSLVLSLAACDLIKKKIAGEPADAAAEAAVADAVDAAPSPAVTDDVTASNEDDVARFPDETKLGKVPATIQRTYNVREAQPAGPVVAALTKGQEVTQIASRSGGKHVLITWQDAKQAKALMGWIHAEAFSAVPAADAGGLELKCPGGEVALFSDSLFCGKVCDKDADCGTGQACKGSAAKWTKGKAGDSVRVCNAVHAHDAGAPAADAGQKPDAGDAKVDAGATTIPVPTADIVDAVDGKCYAGYVVVKKDKRCHKVCAKQADCRAAFYCGECDGTKVCSGTKNYCP